MTYYDQNGRPVDTSGLWRMPSHQASAIEDNLRHNRPKNSHAANFTNPGYYSHGSQGYAPGSGGLDIDIEGFFGLIAKAFVWFFLGGGISLFTLLVFVGIGVFLVDGDDILDDVMAPGIQAGLGFVVLTSLLVGGLIGMMRRLQHASQQTSHMGIMEIIGVAFHGWLQLGLYASSVAVVVVASLHLRLLQNGIVDLNEGLQWMSVPLALALGHLALVRVMPHRFTLGVAAASLLMSVLIVFI